MKSVGLLSVLCFLLGILFLVIYFVIMIQIIIAPYLHILVVSGLFLVFLGVVFEIKRIGSKESG